MQILKRWVFAQTILINLTICTSKIYFVPDDTFNLQNSLEFLPENNNFIFNMRPKDKSAKINNARNSQEYKWINTIDNIKNTQEIDASNSDSEEIDITDTQEYTRTKVDGYDLDVGDLNLNNAQKSMLRKRWRSSCDKKASKTCAVACKNAYKIVCSSYRCKRKMKRDFKKECKRNCRAKFVESVSSIESDTD